MRSKGRSRRQVLTDIVKGVALCSIGGKVGSVSAAVKPAKNRIKLGMSTLGFTDMTNAELAKELAGAGFNLVQLLLRQKDSNYWRYNRRNDLGDLTPARCREIAVHYTDLGHTIHSIGVYTNLLHPDDKELAANLDYFEQMMIVGSHMGVKGFATESGHYFDNTKPATSRVPLEYQDGVWERMVKTMQNLTARAAKYDATIMIEPHFLSFWSTSFRVRRFIEDVGSDRLRVLLDPANILELDDLAEMFRQLRPYIDCIHAKDRKYHTINGVPAGQGDLDYSRFLKLVAEHTPNVPLIFEYVDRKNYKVALQHMHSVIKDVGFQVAAESSFRYVSLV